jgi:hypothetical protein
MAIDVTNVNTVLATRVPQAFEDTVSRNSQAWNLFQKTPPSDAQGPRWSTKITGGAAAENYALGGSFPSGSQYTPLEASMSWGRVVRTIELYGQARNQLEEGASELRITNYFMTQIEDAVQAIVAKVDAEILSTTTTNGATGLQTWIDETGSVANIDRSTYANWRSYQNDNSSTPRAVTKALLDDMHNNLVYVNKGAYDSILVDPAQGDAIAALTTGGGVSQLRDVRAGGDGTQQFAMGFGSQSTDVIGFYRGVPVIQIQGLVSGTAYFLNRSKCRIELLRPLTVSEAYRVNDDFFWDITMIYQFVVPNPKKDGAVLEDLS